MSNEKQLKIFINNIKDRTVAQLLILFYGFVCVGDTERQVAILNEINNRIGGNNNE